MTVTPLSEARKQAQDALGTWHIERMGAALRALLAALPERVLPDGRYECHCCGVAIVPGGVVFCAECYHASVTVWKACPHYTAGERHTGCETCGGFGAVPEEPAVDREAAPGQETLAQRWIESARQYAQNEAYYRGLIVTALAGVPGAYLCDDGSRSEDVLCAKLPEIVAALRSQPDAVREAAERLRQAVERYDSGHSGGIPLSVAASDLLDALDAHKPDETAEACRLHWGTGAGLRAEGKP